MHEETVATRVERIERILNGRINEDHHALLLRLLDENEDGVIALAARIAGDTNVRNPIGLFTTSIKKGMVPHPRKATERAQRPMILTVTPEERARIATIGAQWRMIQFHMRSPDIKALFHELQSQCVNPEDPTNEEGRFVRETLIYAIAHS